MTPFYRDSKSPSIVTKSLRTPQLKTAQNIFFTLHFIGVSCTAHHSSPSPGRRKTHSIHYPVLCPPSDQRRTATALTTTLFPAIFSRIYYYYLPVHPVCLSPRPSLVARLPPLGFPSFPPSLPFSYLRSHTCMQPPRLFTAPKPSGDDSSYINHAHVEYLSPTVCTGDYCTYLASKPHFCALSQSHMHDHLTPTFTMECLHQQ